MARDIQFIQDSEGNWDIDFENGDFKFTDGLDTALYLSVLGEKRASASQVKESILRRGHFTNIFNKVENYEVGSLLWLYINQSKNTDRNLLLAENAINEGLSWFLDDNILTKIETSVSKTKNGLNIEINLISSLDNNNSYYNLFVATFN